MKHYAFCTLLILLNFRFIAYSQNDSLKGGELYSSNFLIDGVQRNFTYYMPANYRKKDLYPVVIFLHDNGKSSKDVIKSYGDKLDALADSSDWIVIYPDAVAAHWNDKLRENSPADTINDVGFISILIDYFRDVYHCDTKRVYVAGLANSGGLAYRLTCDISFKITAIAAFISNRDEAASKCKSDESVSIMNINQAADQEDIIEAWDFFMAHEKK
ncbi:MAG TPA: PHB depolymerase family esterase [Chitinophagaceae bacterium]|jgi:poly(3-hydroxybutyrate) depolymerase